MYRVTVGRTTSTWTGLGSGENKNEPLHDALHLLPSLLPSLSRQHLLLECSVNKDGLKGVGWGYNKTG